MTRYPIPGALVYPATTEDLRQIYASDGRSAIQIGTAVSNDDHHPSDDRMVVRDNTVRSNFIARIGREYYSAVAVLATWVAKRLTRGSLDEGALDDGVDTALADAEALGAALRALS